MKRVKLGDTKFAKGESGNPVGRVTGVPNKTTRLLKDALLLASELEGDRLYDLYKKRGPEALKESGLVAFLQHAARMQLKGFLPLLGRVLPLQIHTTRTENERREVYQTVEQIEQRLRECGIPLKRVRDRLQLNQSTGVYEVSKSNGSGNGRAEPL